MRVLKPLITLLAIITLGTAAYSQELRFATELPIINRKKLHTQIEVQKRLSFDENSNLNKNLATLSLEYDITKHFELGGSYRITSNKNTIEDSESANIFDNEGARATVDLTYKTKKIDKIRVKNKLRYQVSDFENNIEKSYLRNKTLVYYQASSNLKSYAGLEFIYRMEKDELKSFRIHIGNKLKVQKHSVTAYFIIENQFKELPVNLNYIMGLKLTI